MKKIFISLIFLFICFCSIAQAPASPASTPVNAPDLHVPSTPVAPSAPTTTIAADPPRNPSPSTNTSTPTATTPNNGSLFSPDTPSDFSPTAMPRASDNNNRRRMGTFWETEWQNPYFCPMPYQWVGQNIEMAQNISTPTKPTYGEALRSIANLTAKTIFYTKNHLDERTMLSNVKAKTMMDLMEQIQSLSVYIDNETYVKLQPTIRAAYEYAYLNHLKENRFSSINMLRVEKMNVELIKLEGLILAILQNRE
jgi:hypothetical protein